MQNNVAAYRAEPTIQTLIRSTHLEENCHQVTVTPEFEARYAYEGTLGVHYTKEATTFRLWSPVAVSVTVLVYEELYGSQFHSVQMKQIKEGVFEAIIQRDLHGVAYSYLLTYVDNSQIETVDPYATATTVNGERSVVIDLEATNPVGFKRMDSFSAPTDAVIYEASVRDFTMSLSSGAKNRAKFLGVVEAGTTSPNGKITGIDYLKSLGVTHIQFLPMYDFQTVDERNQREKYNWGYDPMNYNVPEGSYATDPYQPAVRIKEMKQMINGLHEAGIRVIMDVVYNHVYEPIGHPFENTAPGYFFRKNADGMLSNGTGCGNDIASEHKMVRKYIVDSVTYWAKEYHLDGFRFDLMGIHDIDTMNEIRAALDEIDPSIIMIGEGWDLQTALPDQDKASSKNAQYMKRIGHFNDALRQALKGSDMDGAKDTGYVTEKAFQEQWIAINQQGGLFYPTDVASYKGPEQMVQYVEAHDNHTLYDKLVVSMPQDDEATRRRRHLLATSAALLAQGISFLHAGQEFLRTKYGVENSYQSPDAINQMDWERRDAYEEEVSYVRDLIALRKNVSLFRLRSAEEIAQHMEVWKADHQQIIWQVEDENTVYLVGFNASNEQIQFPLESRTYETLIYDTKSYISQPFTNEHADALIVEPLSTTVVRFSK